MVSREQRVFRKVCLASATNVIEFDIEWIWANYKSINSTKDIFFVKFEGLYVRS